LPASLRVGPVSAVATDSAGQVYVLQRADPPVLVFDQAGELLRSWGDGKLKAPHGLRIDGDDHVWATDIGRHVVIKFDIDGKVLMSLGRDGVPGDGPDQFNRPTDVAFGPAGEIYVSDGYGNSRVVKFPKEGKFLLKWGEPGNDPGKFDLPHAIVSDRQGRIYVGDRENDRVQVFDSDGKFLAQWKEGGAPYGLSLDGDRLFFADCVARRITVLDLQGKPVGHWPTGEGESNEPHWVCVSGSSVYVAYVGGKRVEKLVAK
jgi:DNA-binding beta-propeller fold protein YncE